jgi:hypothetical protein
MDGPYFIYTVVSTLGLGSLIGIGAKHFLDRGRELDKRVFEARRDAYSKAAATVCGFGHRTVHHIAKNGKDGRTDSIAFVGYLQEISADLSPAILVARPSLAKELQNFTTLAIEGHEIVARLVSRFKDGQTPGKEDKDTLVLSGWKTEIETLENTILQEMKKELGLPV